jgi:hypothetical protein
MAMTTRSWIAASALLLAKIVKNATLKVYPGAPHGMCTTLKNEVNEHLPALSRPDMPTLFCRGINKGLSKAARQ